MSVNKIVTKVDGVENKTIDFNDLKSGLSDGAHTITVEAYNGATLISSQTKNITIVTGYEAETDSYINRVNTDTGSVIDEAYVDTVYKQLKADASLANLLFWMDAKGGMKKDASNFISKAYDLSTSLNDPTQLTGASQPVLNTNIVFDGTDDKLNSSPITTNVGTTLYLRFSTQSFEKMLLGKTGNNSAFCYTETSTKISFQGDDGSTKVSWVVPEITIGALNDMFFVRSSTGYTLYLNGVSYGEKASSAANFDIIGNYNVGGFEFNGGIERISLFNEGLTTTKMNNIIAL